VLTFAVEAASSADLEELTPAERAVAQAAARGMPCDAIAAARGTSSRTVRNQLTSIFKKLKVSSRVDLAAHLARSKRP
jgi:DNA-binding CsgD family transcriptional regulator